MRFAATILLVLGLLLGLNSCTKNPATGKTNLNFMSQAEEIQLGSQAAPQFLKEGGGELPSANILSYVRGIGMQLVAVCERPDLPWEFHVLDSKVINAFALPGGKVFISRGLLEKMSNEAQLAAVLGHEVGHVTAQHIGQQMSRAAVTQGLIGVLGTAGEVADSDLLRVLGAGGQVGGGLYLLKFGRDQESEADMLGIRYMTRAGYNPIGMMQVMQILKEAAGGGGNWDILSTHPDPGRRYDDAGKIIQKNFPDVGVAGKYKFNEPQFQQVVVAGLKKLPPSKAMIDVPARTAALAQGASQTSIGTASVTDAKPGTPSRPLTAMERAMLLAKCNCHPSGGHQELLQQAADPR